MSVDSEGRADRYDRYGDSVWPQPGLFTGSCSRAAPNSMAYVRLGTSCAVRAGDCAYCHALQSSGLASAGEEPLHSSGEPLLKIDLRGEAEVFPSGADVGSAVTHVAGAGIDVFALWLAVEDGADGVQ